MHRRVLIVEDEQNIRDTLAELFDVGNTAVATASTLDEAKRALGRTVFDLILTDLRIGGHRNGGLQVMATAGLLSPDAMTVVLTAYPDEESREAAIRLNATHFLQKPIDLHTISRLAADAGIETALAGACETEGFSLN